MTVVTPTDRPKSVRYRCVIDVFGGVFVLSFGFRIFYWYRVFFVIGLSQIFFRSLLACSPAYFENSRSWFLREDHKVHVHPSVLLFYLHFDLLAKTPISDIVLARHGHETNILRDRSSSLPTQLLTTISITRTSLKLGLSLLITLLFLHGWAW